MSTQVITQNVIMIDLWMCGGGLEITERAASGGTLVPEPPRATHNTHQQGPQWPPGHHLTLALQLVPILCTHTLLVKGHENI